MLALRLPDEIEQRLDDLAAKTGRSKSFYAREAILEELEDAYLGAERLKQPVKRWTQKELEAGLDLGS
jgi:RHH-type transcriptional regulator, rel operon repressor / antitoxin RelB